jgi:hypothetical protein
VTDVQTFPGGTYIGSVFYFAPDSPSAQIGRIAKREVRHGGGATREVWEVSAKGDVYVATRMISWIERDGSPDYNIDQWAFDSRAEAFALAGIEDAVVFA